MSPEDLIAWLEQFKGQKIYIRSVSCYTIDKPTASFSSEPSLTEAKQAENSRKLEEIQNRYRYPMFYGF